MDEYPHPRQDRFGIFECPNKPKMPSKEFQMVFNGDTTCVLTAELHFRTGSDGK